jgi:hypothetical protein
MESRTMPERKRSVGEEFSEIQAATFQADEAAIAKARARGEMYGFSGIFLANFIERELRLMVKWRNRTRVEEAQCPPPNNSPSAQR